MSNAAPPSTRNKTRIEMTQTRGRRVAATTKILALAVAFILGMALWNGIDLPFMPHAVTKFVFGFRGIFEGVLGLGLAAGIIFFLAKWTIRFLEPSFLAAWPNAPRSVAAFRHKVKELLPGLVLIGCLVLAAAAAIGYWQYRLVQVETRSRENHHNPPVADADSVAEIGYIYLRDSRLDLGKHRRDVWWQIKIPSTGEIYYCDWVDGSPDFERDDDVKLIHQRPNLDVPDHSGYIVGLDGKHRGKYAGVWAQSEEDERSVETNEPPEN